MAGTASIGVRLREVLTKKSEASEIQISELLPQGPAKKSGMLHVGDVITKVAGKSVRGLDAGEVYRLLVGQPNSRVRVQVRRGPATFDSTLMREEFQKSEKDEIAKNSRAETTNTSHTTKLTPMEQARKVADGTGGRGVYKYSRRKELGKATEEEAARMRGEHQRVMQEAQKIADKEYDEEKKTHDAELKQRNKEGMQQFWNLVWHGDEKGAPPPAPAAKKEKVGWHRKTAKDIKKTYKVKKNEVIAYFSGIYVEHKINKFTKQVFGQDEKKGWFGKKKKKEQGWCAPCGNSRK